MIRRTRPKQKDCYACMEWNYDWFANDLEEPYQTPEGKPFCWQGRTRVVGGRTNVWGRQSYRLSPLDMKPASFDGFGEDWPLSYEDLVPYYELVEDYVGITGNGGGRLRAAGQQVPPRRWACSARSGASRTRSRQKFGRTATLGRSANLTKPINGRQACHYCGPCERGLRDEVVLQLRLHHRGRRAGQRQLHADPERDGLQGAHRRRRTARPGRPLRRPRHPRVEGGVRPRRWWCAPRPSNRRASS